MLLRRNTGNSEGCKSLRMTVRRICRRQVNTSKIAEVIADDDHHVTFKLTQPYAAFKTIVTQTNLSIVSEAAVTAAGDAYGDVKNVLGSGEFTVTGGFERSLHPHKNEKYWGTEPIATSITVRVIPEEVQERSLLRQEKSILYGTLTRQTVRMWKQTPT